LPSEARSLWESVGAGTARAALHSRQGSVDLAALAVASALGTEALERLKGRTVLVLARGQLGAALALLELDGVAARLVLCTPDLAPEHLPHVIRTAAAEAAVIDAHTPPEFAQALPSFCLRAAPDLPLTARPASALTQWVLLTSGTTGAPKLVLHTLASLMAALEDPAGGSPVWSTFYDIRRYGGLQIFLRAVHAGSLVLSDAAEPVTEFLGRAAAAGVTHISGTPSHWRRALMSGAAATIAPRYVRLSGEIADQSVLDSLRATYPKAIVAHAFASTEAGVAFEVRDGLAGFPQELIRAPGAVEMRVADGTLQIRSAGTALRYLGEGTEPLRGADGYVDTGDRLEPRGGRYHFIGRRGGVINVGGLKVHPEEVEAVINAHPWVRMSLVRARRNAITGAVVTAEVVLSEEAAGAGARPTPEALARQLTERCRQALAAHKVPTTIRIVPSLAVSASGKLVRPDA